VLFSAACLLLLCGPTVPLIVDAATVSCANGNTDHCCHLEQEGWTNVEVLGVQLIYFQARFHTSTECSPNEQASMSDIGAKLCATQCWGSAIGVSGSWTDAPTLASALAGLLIEQCAITFATNGVCNTEPSSSSSSSSSTAAAASVVPSSSSASVRALFSSSSPSSSTASSFSSSSASARPLSSSSSTGTVLNSAASHNARPAAASLAAGLLASLSFFFFFLC
jgi:hypothetical protein